MTRSSSVSRGIECMVMTVASNVRFSSSPRGLGASSRVLLPLVVLPRVAILHRVDLGVDSAAALKRR